MQRGFLVPADLVGAVIGFASGIGVSTIAASIGSQLQKRRERQRRREQAAFEVLMLLLDLNGRYFWVASNELHGEPPPAETVTKVRSLAFQIADKLREADDVPYIEEILTVLMSEDAYNTANDRARALDAVIGNVGKIVHPRYAKLIHDISEKNVRGFVARQPDHKNNAPALMNEFPSKVDGKKSRRPESAE